MVLLPASMIFDFNWWCVSGIVLSWNMGLNETHAQITNYQLFAYQEGNAMPIAALWKKASYDSSKMYKKCVVLRIVISASSIFYTHSRGQLRVIPILLKVFNSPVQKGPPPNHPCLTVRPFIHPFTSPAS
jgi:hypothetical protein